MLLLRVLLLWFLISLNVVGAAVLFRRLFPRECPWLGFFIAPLTFIVGLNFIEHFVALPNLGWLLPITTFVLLWQMLKPGYSWQGLLLPTGTFLGIFAFVMAMKAFLPNISNLGEGTADLNRILDFCQGETLPPTDGWLPPYDHRWYYTFQHYGASVLKRMFVLDIGTGYNCAFALLESFIILAGAGTAYYAGGKKIWVMLTTVFFIIATFSGSSAIIDVLTSSDPKIWLAFNLNIDWDQPDKNPLSFLLKKDPYHETLKLFPPGTWIWLDEYHPNLSGHFLSLCAALATQVVLFRERSNWPWVCLLILPFLAVISATWFLLVVSFLCLGGLVVAIGIGRRPEKIGFVLLATVGALALLWPTLGPFMTWSHDQEFGLNPKEWRTPFWMFVLQWWPIYLPWFLLCFIWPRLSATGRWFHFAVAALFIGVEFINVGAWRLDTIEKMWGAIYGVGLVTLVPMILAEKAWPFRIGGAIISMAAFISLWCWLDNTISREDWRNTFLRFDGDSFMTVDPRKKRMLQVLQPYRAATILTGHCEWAYSEAQGLAVFTENRCYSAWYFSENICGHEGEAEYRVKLNNDFYDGKLPDPLAFLEDNNITAVVIWPGDKISDATLAALTQKITPGYRYIDCRQVNDHDHDYNENAGIFLRRPPSRREGLGVQEMTAPAIAPPVGSHP